MSTFQELGLNADLINAIEDLGFKTPSEVQQKAIPVLLEEERDLVTLAQTGTGKTGAFLLPILHKMEKEADGKNIQVVILSPK